MHTALAYASEADPPTLIACGKYFCIDAETTGAPGRSARIVGRRDVRSDVSGTVRDHAAAVSGSHAVRTRPDLREHRHGAKER